MRSVEYARQAAHVEELKAAARAPRITAEERTFALGDARAVARALDACVDDDERIEVLAGALVMVARSTTCATLRAVGLDVLASGFDDDDPSTHTAPRRGVWYRVLPASERGALVARFSFEALLGKRLVYRRPNGDTGVIESYRYDLPEPCEFRLD